MALTARKQRDPNDSTQILRTKKHGEVRVAGKFWMGGTGVPKIIILTPEGGYRKARGGAILSEKELIDVIPPGPELDKALLWWANKDNWQKNAPRKITFQDGTGYPIYEDTGEFVEDEDTLQNYWPATGPTKHILWGAIAALNARRDAKVVQREPAVAPQPSAPQVNNVTLAVAPAPISAPAPALQAKKTLFKKGQPWSKERKAQASARYQAAKAAPVTE